MNESRHGRPVPAIRRKIRQRRVQGAPPPRDWESPHWPGLVRSKTGRKNPTVTEYGGYTLSGGQRVPLLRGSARGARLPGRSVRVHRAHAQRESRRVAEPLRDGVRRLRDHVRQPAELPRPGAARARHGRHPRARRRRRRALRPGRRRRREGRHANPSTSRTACAATRPPTPRVTSGTSRKPLTS